MTAAPLTDALAGFIASFAPGDLPAPIAARTLEVVQDGSACLGAAANPAWSTGRLIAVFVRVQGGAPEASVVAHGFRTGAVHAALANGTMGYACDFEPHHPAAILHPIAVRDPGGAGGEPARRRDRPGNLLAAVALGCEVEYRTFDGARAGCPIRRWGFIPRLSAAASARRRPRPGSWVSTRTA